MAKEQRKEDLKYLGKEAFLDILSVIPGGSVIVRRVDTILSDKRFQEIERDISKIWKELGQEGRGLQEKQIFEGVISMNSSGLIDPQGFRRFQASILSIKFLYHSSLRETFRFYPGDEAIPEI